MSPSVQQAIAQLNNKPKLKGLKSRSVLPTPKLCSREFGREGLDVMLEGGVDVVFCNCDEAQLFTNQISHSQAAAALLSVANMAVVTSQQQGQSLQYETMFHVKQH
ncbi:MAG: hypothetical protein U1E92_00575 [Moraxella osloensis]